MNHVCPVKKPMWKIFGMSGVAMKKNVHMSQKARIKMNKKLAEFRVSKSEDCYDKVVNALKDAGFVIVLDCETASDTYYIVAESDEETGLKNCKTCGQNCAIRHYGCSNWKAKTRDKE